MFIFVVQFGDLMFLQASAATNIPADVIVLGWIGLGGIVDNPLHSIVSDLGPSVYFTNHL